MLDKDKPPYCFSADVLESIIDKNLTLYQYYDHLLPILRRGLVAHELGGHEVIPQDQPSPKEKLRSPTSSPLDQESEEQVLFPFELIQECLVSQQFIGKLHPYVNSLFTTTNIGIVRETLKIYMLMGTNLEKFRALRRIKEVVNILTLYQVDKNVTHLLGEINTLNSIFCKIGLIITTTQFEFYNNNIWSHIPTESIDLGHAHHNSKKMHAKHLQIYDLLPLAVEMEEIKTLKLNLHQWMNSQQFEKFNAKRAKMMREKAKLGEKQQVEENMDIVRLRIQHLAPHELLKEINIRGYAMDKNDHKFSTFRQQLMELRSKEDKKSEMPNPVNSTSCKMIGSNSNANWIKSNKSKLLNSFAKQLVPPKNISERTQTNRQKLEQQAFNLKVLNGCFVRKQILQDLEQGNVEFFHVYDGPEDTNGSHFHNPVAVPTFVYAGIGGENKEETAEEEKTKNSMKMVAGGSDRADDSLECRSPKSNFQGSKRNGKSYRQKIEQKMKGEPFFRMRNVFGGAKN